MIRLIRRALVLLLFAANLPLHAQTLKTRWTDDVAQDPAGGWREYPRPQLVRESWMNLNGRWEYAIRPRGAAGVQSFDGQILVPFAAESYLSGVQKQVGGDNELWYRREIELPDVQQLIDRGQRVLLHFGAVDWQMTAWLNGQEVGQHVGGYEPFTFDITEALEANHPQELIVRVWDPTDDGFQPRGKQVNHPEGIWYTAVTGIWRTVWLETVPALSVADVQLTPDVDAGELRVQLTLRGTADDAQIWAQVHDGAAPLAIARGEPSQSLTLKIPHPHLWSPDDPFLYNLTLGVSSASAGVQDQLSSYFAMRQISVGPDENGVPRLLLNKQPLFQFGPLDQGWWPDGLYTAPGDEALRYDLEITKQLGFNMIRKHVKLEPDRWYYHCDRLGILVWQDMPNGDRHIGPQDADLQRSAESAENYRREWKAIIDAYGNHPCIVTWVPFNEGWGQFETQEILEWTKEYDPTRLVDGPSGWTDRGVGHMHDMHAYPGPAMPRAESERAVVLGEFGGLGLPLKGHLWRDRDNWGYRTYATREELTTNYKSVVRRLRPLIARGLSAAVYTQTTDVEGEVNGLLTYDREVIKMDVAQLADLHRQLYLPQPPLTYVTLAPTGEQQPQQWRYTISQPDESWTQLDFDDGQWNTGVSGFGERSTPGSVVRTEWKSNDIWLRREISLDSTDVHQLYLRIHHDEDTEVYLNGQQVASLSGYQVEYFDLELDPAAKAALREGKNVLAVHCRQTGGGQYIDAGLLDARPK